MRRPEQALQIKLVSTLRQLLPKPWLVVHVRNQGEQRSKRAHGILKAMGVVAGFPDLLVIGPSGKFTTFDGEPLMTAEQLLRSGQYGVAVPQTIAIELKAPPKMLKSGQPSKAKPAVSEAQRDVIETLHQCGIPTIIVRSMDEAIDALKAMGVPLKGRAL